jgi:hypothetical protein
LPWKAAPRAELRLDADSGGVGAHDPGFAQIVEDRPGRLAVATAAEGRALLATTERFHEGWRATVDGKPTETLEVEGFIGCMVEPGVHQVRFRFMPRSFVRGAITSAAGALLLALGTLVTLRRRERPATS